MAVETILEGRNGHIVRIGVDHSFSVIGERINPTGRKSLGPEFVAGDFTRARSDALAQIEAGAKVLDVNAGIPGADEPAILAQVIKEVQSITDVPICIDSSTFEALEPALQAVEGKPLLNSVTGEDESLERILPLVKKYGCAVIGMANDDTGISMEIEDRFRAAKKIVDGALDFGIPREDVLIDPLAMPVGAATAAPAAAVTTFEITRRVRAELDVNLSCGASNISFGLPDRHGVDAAFLPMLMMAGMAASITNPLAADVRRAILAADVLLDHDDYSTNWVSFFRARQAAKEQA